MAETTQAVQAKPKRGMSKSLRDSLVAYSFIAPNFIGFCIFTLVPMIFAIGLSFCNWDGVHPVEFTGISNFVALLSDKTFKAAFVNTLVYAVGTVPLTLEEIADAFFISKSYLSHEFVRYTNTSVYEYIQFRRICGAKLLIASGVSLTDAAFQSGFNSYSSFLRTFRKTVGISPTDFQRNLGK